VRRVPIEVSSAERARWLAELAKAIDEAQKVAWRLGVQEGDDAEAKDLYERLEAARVEVDALRRGGFQGVVTKVRNGPDSCRGGETEAPAPALDPLRQVATTRECIEKFVEPRRLPSPGADECTI
jgi:hypothetical protein